MSRVLFVSLLGWVSLGFLVTSSVFLMFVPKSSHFCFSASVRAARRRYPVVTNTGMTVYINPYDQLFSLEEPFSSPVPTYEFYVHHRKGPDQDNWDLCRRGVALATCHSFRGLSILFHVLVSSIAVIGTHSMENLYKKVIEAAVFKAGWSSVRPLYCPTSFDPVTGVPPLSSIGAEAWDDGLAGLRINRYDVPWFCPTDAMCHSCTGWDVDTTDLCGAYHGKTLLKMHPFLPYLDLDRMPFTIHD